MPKWLLNTLGFVYEKVPKKFRPFLKKLFYLSVIRIEALFTLKKIYNGKRVEFVDFEIANLEPFEFLGPGNAEVMVESFCSVVSPGTESAVLCGMPGARKSFPYYPGYSTAGIITKTGGRVKNFSVGDRVAGRIHHMSHEVLTPRHLFKIPENVAYEEAGFIELGIIILQGVRKAGIKPGDKVAVVGQGLIGQLSNRLVRLVGASQIIAVASSSNRSDTALLSGSVDEYIALSDKKNIASEIQADVVIEAVGTPLAVITALECVCNGGKVVLLGSSRGLGRNIDWWNLAQKRDITVIGAHISAMPDKDASPGRWTYQQEGELFLQLLSSGRLKVADLITWRAKPEECNAVYEVLAAGGRQHVGIMFEWQKNIPENSQSSLRAI